MWLVRLALRRPYTFVVLAMVILLIGMLTISRMATDIYPEIDIPVVATIWTYTGLSPQEMEGRITTQFERAVTTTVSGIEHIESQSLAGIAVVKVYLQPGSSVIGGVTEVAAAAQPLLRSLPPGATAPGILQYSASDTAILQLAISSPTLAEQQIYDVATNFLRPGLATVPGAQLPLPLGGKQRQIVVDLDPQKLFAWKLSPSDVSAAIARQNLIAAAGGEDRPSGIRHPRQRQPRRRGRVQRPPGAHCGYHDRLPEGHCLCARRVRAPDKCRRNRQQQGRSFARPQGTWGEHARRRGANACDIARRRGNATVRLSRHADVRSIGVRARPRVDCGTRGGDRSGIDRCDDPDLPRQLAQHLDRARLHSALAPRVDHRARLAWPDAQPHDTRWVGARSRHPR